MIAPLSKAPPRNPVWELQRLLGQAVFLKCTGKRPMANGWPCLKLSDMTPEYLASLRDGNIGVSLGEVSVGLCVIDFDDDKYLAPFLAANPVLAQTLRLFGNRGCSFWIRCKGRYPGSFKLKATSGEAVGEFRANGNQSIVWGIHPKTNAPYQRIVNAPPVELEFAEIRWPDYLDQQTLKALGQLSLGQDSLGQVSLGTVLKDVSYVTVESGGGGGAVPVLSLAAKEEIDEAIKIGAESTRQNNSASFHAVLALLRIRDVESVKDMPKGERQYFEDAWYERLKALGRVTKPKSHYCRDIKDSIQKAKRYANMKTNDAVHQAWMLARTSPLPPEAARFDGDKLTQDLIALGYALHVIHKGCQWPLGRDKAGRVMGLRDSQIRRDLDDSFKAIIPDIFEVARPHDKERHLATEYKYVGQEAVNDAQPVSEESSQPF